MKTRSAVTLAALGAGAWMLAAPGAWAQSLVNARVLAAAPVYQSVPVTQCAPAYGQTSGAGAAVGSLLRRLQSGNMAAYTVLFGVGLLLVIYFTVFYSC